MASASPTFLGSPIADLDPTGGLGLGRRKADIEAAIDQAIGRRLDRDPRLAEAMRYAVLGAGKRFRALLVLAAGDAVGARTDQALRVAAAVECVHAQSLVHDDLPCMDDDDLRRGRPSLHRKFDEATAVLAGDALLALAFEIIASPDTHPDGEVRARLVLALARALGQDGLAGGQMMDLYAPDRPTSRHAFQCQSRKTGALIRYAVEAAAMLGECGAEERGHLLRFADNLGLAFQIRDDLLDSVGDPAVVGKALRKDPENGRKSATLLLGIEGAAKRAKALEEACHAALDTLGARATALHEFARFAACRMY